MLRQVFSEAKILISSASKTYARRYEIMNLSLSEMASRSMDNYKKHLEEKTKILTTCGTIGATYAIGEIIAQSITKNYDFSRVGVFWLYGTALGGPAYYAWFNVLDKLPGNLLISSNKYQDLICNKFPKFIENHITIKTQRNLVTDAKTQFELKIGDQILPSNTDIKVYVPEKTILPISALKFEARRIEKIDKWTVKGVKVLADQLLFSSTYILFLITATGFMTGGNLVSVAQTIQTSFWKIYLIDCVVWPPLQLINFTFVKKEYQPIYVNVLNIVWNTFLSLCLSVQHYNFIFFFLKRKKILWENYIPKKDLDLNT